MCLNDKDELERYASHPLHVKVKKECIGPCLREDEGGWFGPKVAAVDWFAERDAGRETKEGLKFVIAALAGAIAATAVLSWKGGR